MRLHELKHPLKTALAATLALVVYQALHLKHGYWAVISAIIVMQSNLGRSLQASSQRLIGTAIGALIGAAAFRVGGRNAASFFVAIAVTLALCAALNLRDSMRLAGVTVAIVMLIGEETAFQAGVSRFIDVALGVIIAVLVSVAWPSRARDELRRSLADNFVELRDLFAMVGECALARRCDREEIDVAKAAAMSQSRRNAVLIADAEREPGANSRLLESLHKSSERIRDHIYGIDYSARPMQHDHFPHLLEAQLCSLFKAIRQSFDKVIAELRDEPPPVEPRLYEALEQLEMHFSELRQSGATLDYRNDELLRFYSLFYRLRQLSGELLRDSEYGKPQERAA